MYISYTTSIKRFMTIFAQIFSRRAFWIFVVAVTVIAYVDRVFHP